MESRMDVRTTGTPHWRYLSLFSGIGVFETALHQQFGADAQCVGFSEIKPAALKVYTRHFPDHTQLGDVLQLQGAVLDALITRTQPNLLVAGFPCTNLSSIAAMNGDNSGIYAGDQGSGLFFRLLSILSACIRHARTKNYPFHFVLENVASMSKDMKEEITQRLTTLSGSDCLHCTLLCADAVSAQRRKRLFWTRSEEHTSEL